MASYRRIFITQDACYGIKEIPMLVMVICCNGCVGNYLGGSELGIQTFCF
jgi:hypothetical protein